MLGDALLPLGLAAAAALGAFAMMEAVHRLVRRLSRRSAFLAELSRRARRPLQTVVVLFAVHVALRLTTTPAWLLHGLWLAIIGAVAWLVAALLLVAEDAALARLRTDVPDNRRARQVHTQVVVIRRVTVAAVAVLAVGAMLMTFPQARSAGASLLASAGLIGVIAGLAAQSVLGNMFAGMQLAFSDAVRLGDVVVVEGEWGRIEEITLSYVVVHVWDDRRLVLPTSYFAGKPFENWTRQTASLLGTVELDVDWSVPVEPMRDELRRVLSESPLWDGRVCVLQVTDAVSGLVRVRAVMSAVDAPTLWDLRCLVREHLVGWVRSHHPHALPRLRTELTADAFSRPAAPPSPSDGPPPLDARIFGGSRDGRSRSQTFTGPPEGEA